MTSKEALERIKNTIIVRRNYNRVVSIFNQEEIETIEKDLEILEILKNKVVDITILYFSTCIEVYNCGFANKPKFQLTQEEYTKLKEWLKNGEFNEK